MKSQQKFTVTLATLFLQSHCFETQVRLTSHLKQSSLNSRAKAMAQEVRFKNSYENSASTKN